MNLTDYHWEYGRHSNIPDCCIEFWIREWGNIMASPARKSEYHISKDTAEFKLRKEYRYIPCPKCIKTLNWKPIHVCTKVECGDFKENLKKRTGVTFPL